MDIKKIPPSMKNFTFMDFVNQKEKEQKNKPDKEKAKEFLKNKIGFKFFKDEGDYLVMYRLLRVAEDKVYVEDCADKSRLTVPIESLFNYSPLEPDGYITFNIVTLPSGDHKSEVEDVIVTVSKYLNLMMRDVMPYAVCRQSITDFFYNLMCVDEGDQIVGMSMNQENCPTNFDFRMMIACNAIKRTTSFNFYRNDTLEDILGYIDTKKYDMCLNKLFTGHMRVSGHANAVFKNIDDGWCKDLKTLLVENGFQYDINQMLGITDVIFNMKDYIIQKELPNGEMYDSVVDELRIWFAGTFRVAMQDITVIPYNHDINLGDFNNSLYFFIRDNSNQLYFCVYTVEGKYLESDLQAQYEALDVADRWRLAFLDKYRNMNKLDNDSKIDLV